MQSGWRLYAVMIGLAALTGTVVALALSGGPRLPSESPRGTFVVATSTATPSPTRSPATTASGSPAPSPTATPTPTATPSDPLARIRPLAFSWRPTETTAVVEKLTIGGTRLIAVPLGSGAAVPLVDLPTGTQWHLRLDGSAIAMTVEVGSDVISRTRIAALNLQTGALGWVTPDEPFVTQRSPRWSNDGTVVYYTRQSFDRQTDLGIYRVRVDGTNLTQLRAPSNDGAIEVRGLTPDGLGLVLDRSVLSGLVDILDLNTRTIRSYQAPRTLTGASPSAFVESWRPQRPRALVGFSGGAAALQLYVWDDLAAPVDRSPIVRRFYGGADWDPAGTRVVAAMPADPNSPSELVTMDASGQNQTTLSGTSGASSPYWLRAGIVYLYANSLSRPTEVRLAQPTGTLAPRILFVDTDIIRLTYVTP